MPLVQILLDSLLVSIHTACSSATPWHVAQTRRDICRQGRIWMFAVTAWWYFLSWVTGAGFYFVHNQKLGGEVWELLWWAVSLDWKRAGLLLISHCTNVSELLEDTCALFQPFITFSYLLCLPRLFLASRAFASPLHSMSLKTPSPSTPGFANATEAISADLRTYYTLHVPQSEHGHPTYNNYRYGLLPFADFS